MANIPVRRDLDAFMPPIPSGPDHSMADLLTADIAPDTIGRILLDQSAPDTLQLLASILRNQRKNNAGFQPIPYSLSAYNQQRVLTGNPRRSYFILQNVSAGDIYVAFEDASENVQSFSADTQTLIAKQVRAIRIIGGGSYEPLVAPTNPITLFTLNAAAYGVVIEGQ